MAPDVIVAIAAPPPAQEPAKGFEQKETKVFDHSSSDGYGAAPGVESAATPTQSGGNTYLTYLAALFIGEVDEETRDLDQKLDRAADDYRIAVAAIPLAPR